METSIKHNDIISGSLDLPMNVVTARSRKSVPKGTGTSNGCFTYYVSLNITGS